MPACSWPARRQRGSSSRRRGAVGRCQNEVHSASDAVVDEDEDEAEDEDEVEDEDEDEDEEEDEEDGRASGTQSWLLHRLSLPRAGGPNMYADT